MIFTFSMRTLFAALIAIGLCAPASARDLPPGWSVAPPEGDAETLRHTAGGAPMTLRIEPWRPFDARDLESWLKANAATAFGPIEVRRVRAETLELSERSDALGAYQAGVVMRELRSDSAPSSVLFVCARDGRLRGVNLYGAAAGFGAPNMLSDVTAIFATACAEPPSGPTPAQPPAAPPRDAARPDFSAAPQPDGLNAVWYLGYVVAGVNGARARYKAVAVFEDGAVSEDPGLFADGVAASRARHADEWGVWRLDGEELEIRWSDRDSFKTYFFSVPAQGGGADHRLEGCFSSRTGFSIGFGGGASASMSVNTWCFGPGGRFSNDRSAAVSGAGASGAGSGGAAGWYRIDGNVIQLRYDDGRRISTLFALANLEDPTLDTVLLLGEGRYEAD